MIKIKLISPKAMLAGATGLTGISAPSAIAGSQSSQINSLKIEVKNLEEELNTNRTLQVEIKAKNDNLSGEEAKLRKQLARVMEWYKREKKDAQRIIELLSRDKQNLLTFLNESRNLKKVLRYVADKCGNGRCEGIEKLVGTREDIEDMFEDFDENALEAAIKEAEKEDTRE